MRRLGPPEFRLLLGLLALPLLTDVGTGGRGAGPLPESAAAFVALPAGRPAPLRNPSRPQEPGTPAASPRKPQMPPRLPATSRRGNLPIWREALAPAAALAGLQPKDGSLPLSELSKPAYLRVRLLSTPTNHRAPPA